MQVCSAGYIRTLPAGPDEGGYPAPEKLAGYRPSARRVHAAVSARWLRRMLCTRQRQSSRDRSLTWHQKLIKVIWVTLGILSPRRPCSSLPRGMWRRVVGNEVYRYAPHNDVSVNDGPHIRRWSHNIIIEYYNTYHCVTIAYSIQYSNMLYRFVAWDQ